MIFIATSFLPMFTTFVVVCRIGMPDAEQRTSANERLHWQAPEDWSTLSAIPIG